MPQKYKDGGIENAISDAPGRGLNAEITDEEKAWIISVACQKPTDFGYAAETWTYARLTQHINSSAEEAGYVRLSTLTKTSIKNILDAADIKPFRIQYYCEKRDLEFDAKMHDVLIVYKQVAMLFDEEGQLLIPVEEQDIHTISYDEKPGIQAIATTAPGLKPTTEHGSWLNMIEGFFGKMTRQMLRGIRVKTKEELVKCIYQYFDEINQTPVVHHWKYRLDDIKDDVTNQSS